MKNLRPENKHSVVMHTACHPVGSLLLAVLFIIAGNLMASAATPGLHLTGIQTLNFPRVECLVTVEDGTGATMAGLSARDFTVEEDGHPVTAIACLPILPEGKRVAVMLVLDRSASMRGEAMTAMKAAAIDFIDRISRDDLLGVVTFSGTPDPAYPPSTARAAARQAVAAVEPQGETAFFDALATAVQALAACDADRKAVIALSDGYDTSSRTTGASCITAAAAQHVAIYSIGLGKAVDQGALRHLAQATGGQLYFAESPDNLRDIYRQIAYALYPCYLLAYESVQPAEARMWRTVAVTLRERDGDFTDQRQYLALRTSSVPLRNVPILLIAGVIAGTLVNLTLLILLWRRKSKGDYCS